MDPGSEWGATQLDLDAYLRRVDYRGRLDTTAETIRRLHRAHLAAIPFENIDVALGRGVGLDLASLQQKLVRQLRGGYCYEHNLLFAAVLERAGFRVTRLLARVRMGTDKILPRSHATLLVEAGDTRWLADVGFGSEGLVEPIPFRDGATTTVGSWTWRLDHDGDWVLRALHDDGWFDLYAFALERQHHVDFVVANHFTATHPSSPFVDRLVVHRTGPYVRHSLHGAELTTRRATGTATRALSDTELPDVLRDTFALALSPGELARIRTLT